MNDQPAPPSPEDFASTRRALGLLLVGAVLVVFDVHFQQTTNGRGIRFDFLNDAVGCLLILFGAKRIADLPGSPLFRAETVLATVVAGLSIAEALLYHLIFPYPDGLVALLGLLGVAQAVAIVSFGHAMHLYCAERALHDRARSWAITAAILLVGHGLPLVLNGGAYLLGGLGLRPMGPANLPFGLAWGVAQLVGLAFFVVTAWRTRADLEARLAPAMP